MDTVIKTVRTLEGINEKSFNFVILPIEISQVIIGNSLISGNLDFFKENLENSQSFCYEIPNSKNDSVFVRLFRGDDTKITEIFTFEGNLSILERFSRVVLKSGSRIYAGNTLIVVDWVSSNRVLMTSRFKKKVVRYTIEKQDFHEFFIGESEVCSVFVRGAELFGKFFLQDSEWVVESKTDMWVPCTSRKNLNISLPFDFKFTSGLKVTIFDGVSEDLHDFP
jgi:hypothetical protein